MNNWITKGILVSRDKLKFYSEIYKKITCEAFMKYCKIYKKKSL